MPTTRPGATSSLTLSAHVSPPAPQTGSTAPPNDSHGNGLGRRAEDRRFLSVSDFGATGDGISDDTEAIQTAIISAAELKVPLRVPAGTYKVVPATRLIDARGPVTIAFEMVSNMQIKCEPGAILRLADNQSTDSHPRELSMFETTSAISNVSITGCTLDMNYQNNKISPNRGTSYNVYNFAHIFVSGDHASITDAEFEYDVFLNTPGATCIGLGQTNMPGSPLGDRITIAHDRFKNNGMDVGDFSCIYGWANHLDIYDNIFTQDSPAPTESPYKGKFMAFELHGAESKAHHNRIFNYMGGGYVANNYTSPVENIEIYNNSLTTTWEGILLFNSHRHSHGVRGVKIYDNAITFIDHPYSGSGPVQIGIGVMTMLPVNDVEIIHNHFAKSAGSKIAASAFRVAPPPAVAYTGLNFTNNTVEGFDVGAEITTSLGGSIGEIKLTGNTFFNIDVTNGFGGDGVFVNAMNGIESLRLSGNSYINTAGTSYMYGVYLTKGTISNLYLSDEKYSELALANYAEAGAIDIVTRW